MTFTTADLDGPGQSPKSLKQVSATKPLAVEPGVKRKRKRGRSRRKKS